jgi:L-ribulose-5-phosphate 4-epimerase
MGTENLDRNVVDQLKVKVADGCRILAKLGLADYLGHVSARVPGTDYVLIKARGNKIGNLLDTTPDKIVMVDLEGNQVEGNYPPPSETRMHTEVYKARPDVGGVVHDHQLYATTFGCTEKPILPMGFPMMAKVANSAGPYLPVFQGGLKVQTAEQGAAIAQRLGDAVAVLMSNHGILTVGKAVEDAVINAIWLENQAKITLLASLIGKAMPMSEEQVARNVAELAPPEGRWRYYMSLLEQDGGTGIMSNSIL